MLNNRYPILASVGHRVAVVFACLLFSFWSPNSQALGQGLLGKQFVSVGFSVERPNDSLLQDISDWAYDVTIIGNLPLTETIDINVDLSTGWFDGTTNVGAIPITFDLDVTSFSAIVVKHFLPEKRIDPFTGIGIGYSKTKLKASSGTVTTSSEDDDVSLEWVAGFEWKLTERWALRPQIRGVDSLDGFDFGNVLVDNLFVETQVIYWWNERWFSGFAIGSDFDDTEVALGFFLGFGQ